MERHLLLVDDEPNVLFALRRSLRREGYVTWQAANGEEALQVLEHHPIDVVVSDQRMPLMTGAELLSQVGERWPHTVRLMLSGYNEGQAQIDNLFQGAAWKFMFKPWDDEVLRSNLRQAFELVETQALTRRLQEEVAQARLHVTSMGDRMLEDSRRLNALRLRLEVLEEALEQLPLPCLVAEYGHLQLVNNAAHAYFSGRGMVVRAGLLSDALDLGDDWIRIGTPGNTSCFVMIHHPQSSGMFQ